MFGLSSKESFLLGVAFLWIFSAAVSALTEPTSQSSPFYKWFFQFMKSVSGDLSTLFGKYLPPSAAAVNSTQKLGAIALCMLLVMGTIVGCSQKTGTTVATDIVNWTPSVESAITVIDNTAAGLLPADAAIFTTATAGIDAAGTLLVADAKAYLANPSASVLANLQTAVTSLEQTVNSAILQAAGIKDTASQKLALAALSGLSAAVTTILGLVQSVSTTAQLKVMSQESPIKLAQVQPYLDLVKFNENAKVESARLNYPISVGHFFNREAQMGF